MGCRGRGEPGEGRKGEGGEWMGNAEAPREKGAPENGVVRKGGFGRSRRPSRTCT